MTGIPLVQSEAPTDKLRRMEQRLHRILRALQSLCPPWLLVLCMVVAYSVSCADFVFEAVANLLAWVLRGSSRWPWLPCHCHFVSPTS